jgi:rhodanese-related sulfurtransferase
MKQTILLLLCTVLLLLTACTSPEGYVSEDAPNLTPEADSTNREEQQGQTESEQGTEHDAEKEESVIGSYINITAVQAKALMDGDEPYVIVDVRTKEEYDEGHVPGAVLLPLDDIDAASAASVLPDKNVMLLVYCRSGRRSKLASEQLLALGYTDIREFGGILDWTYGTEK